MSGGPQSVAVRAASARWQVRRRQLVAAGQWQPFVDAELVREHLRKVNAAGMPFRAICERLGLPHESSLQHLMWGRGTYGPGRQVRRETAELVLSYWPTLADFPEGARIDAIGTRRRVQALVACGWSRRVMAERLGMDDQYFRKVANRQAVTARIARQVAALYDEWWNQDPLKCGVPETSVSRARAEAARLGFQPPLAWDDDTIDDPAAVPNTDAPEPGYTEGDDVVARWLMGESVVLDRAGRREAIAHLLEWTAASYEEVAARLEMTADAVDKSWERTKKKARAEGRAVPWRRVYVPLRDRDMNRDDMRSAA